MAQYKQTENKTNSEPGSRDVVDMAKYKQHEETVSAGTSAFEQVMSQMNIADRCAFENQFAQLWQEASDDKELLSVLICEIDFFKEYHDNYGQQGASFMLLVVGLALKNICEQHDCFLAHYQKEEFAILIKAGDEQQVLEVAENLRQAVEASRTEHKFSKVSDIVTLSIGISSIYPTSMRVLMREADSALLDAKASGRNQVCGNFPQKIENSFVNEAVTTGTEPLSHFKQFMLDMEIADRSSFKRNFVEFWQESANEKELLSMLICEVDFFQAYRENCGSQASEDVLLIVACAFQQTCEKFGGSVYHLGGEKFVVLIKGGNATNALRVAEYLHTFIAESSTEHKYSEVSDVVTVSVGLSSLFPSDSNSMKMLEDEAEKALQVAITSGRDQTSVH